MDSDRPIEKIAPRVWYEWATFNNSFKRVLESKKERDQDAVNAYLESFLIHARNLRDFLTRSRDDKGVKPNDVLAEDFFDSDGWSCPDEPPYLKENRIRLNRSLAHLTYDRIQYQSNKGWNPQKIFHEVKELWTFFLSKLPPEKREWFNAR